MRLAFLTLIICLSLPFAAQAQSVTGCERKQTEEEYQKCIERSGGNDGFDPQDWGTGSVTAPSQDPIPQDKKDQLPPESQQQIAREMAKKVYAQVPEWTPQTRNQDFEYEPSEAAKNDADLKAREEAAFAEAVQKYHAREQKAYETRQGGGGGNGTDPSSGSGNPNVTVGGDINAPDAEQSGGGGAAAGQSRSAVDILGDLNVLGDPNGNPQAMPSGSEGSIGADGAPQVIAGDVTIGGGGVEPSGDSSQNQSSPAAQAGDSAAPEGSDGASDQTAQAPNADDGQDPSNASRAGSADGVDQAQQSEEQHSQSGAQSEQADARRTAGQPSEQNDTAQSGQPSQSTQLPSDDTPQPAPSRPIPPADPIAAAILASLFGDTDESEDPDDQPSAPFVDWTDPDAAAQINAAAKIIAEDTDVTVTAPSVLTGTDEETGARQEAFAAASEQMAEAPPQGSSPPSAQAQARLSTMTLP